VEPRLDDLAALGYSCAGIGSGQSFPQKRFLLTLSQFRTRADGGKSGAQLPPRTKLGLWNLVTAHFTRTNVFQNGTRGDPGILAGGSATHLPVVPWANSQSTFVALRPRSRIISKIDIDRILLSNQLGCRLV
jgi:hypothetical protein